MVNQPDYPVVVRGEERPPMQLEGTAWGSGAPVEGQGEARLLALGPESMLVEIRLRKGFRQPGHVHPHNESIGYVISGKLAMRIGDEEYVLGAGDTWFHPKGVHHITEALEDTFATEMHTPQRPDILEAFQGRRQST
jgi:quercetin dioxygenase-like cupin family protein